MASDETVPDICRVSHRLYTLYSNQGKTEQSNVDKYAKLANTHIYLFPMETAGILHDMAILLFISCDRNTI